MVTLYKNNPFLFIQVLFIVLACFFSQGHFHFDEHFQILEFLNFKLGNIKSHELPWEFAAQIRPWSQVFVYFITTKFLYFFNLIDPFILPIFFRFMTAVLSIISLFLTTKVVQKKYSLPGSYNLLFASAFTLWFWPFLSARISAECFNGLIFYNCVLIYLLQTNVHRAVKFSIFFVMLFAIWGRIQIAPALLGFCFWAYFVDKSLKGNLAVMFIAFASSILVNLAIDFWGYNVWTLTPWNYFYHNLFNDRASSFGVSPWYSYFPWIITKSGNPIGGLLIVLSLFFLWVQRPKSMITWITLPFIMLHLLIGHKELRFLFPVAFFVPLILVEIFGPLMQQKHTKVFVYTFAVLNLAIGLVMSLRPASALIPIYKVMMAQKLPVSKLYYFGGENPLRPGDLPMNWYFSNDFQTINIESAKEITENDRTWVFTDRHFRWKELQRLEDKHTCVRLSKSPFEFLYDFVPEKIMSKTRIFVLWECQVIRT